MVYFCPPTTLIMWPLLACKKEDLCVAFMLLILDEVDQRSPNKVYSRFPNTPLHFQ
jgi:hypothetical protein